MEHRVSNAQLEELINYLMEHPSLAKGVGLGSRSKETVDRLWEELASKLNAHGRGSSKSGQRWKRYWADLKHKVKARAAAQRRDACGTGGGPARQDNLSEIDKKVLSIIGEAAVYGDTQHRVPAFPTPSTSTSVCDLNTAVEIPIIENFSPDCAEVEVITESPPPPPIMRTPISPSTSGHIGAVYTVPTPQVVSSPGRSQDLQLPSHHTDSPVLRQRSRSPIRRNILGTYMLRFPSHCLIEVLFY